MTDSDNPKFMELIAGVLSFYGQATSPFAMSVWWEACKQSDLSEVRRALTAHATDPEAGRFPPKPADIVRQLRGTVGDRAMLAWGKVYDAIRLVGAYRSVAFDDGAIHAAIHDMGGWPKLCRTGTDELQFVQRRFCDFYKAYAGRSQFDYPKYLPGEHEQQNAVLGFECGPPALIGNPTLVRSVIGNGTSNGKTEITLPGPRAVDLAKALTGAMQ